MSPVHNFLEKGRLGVVFIRPAQHFTDLGQGKALRGGTLEEQGRYFHVAEALGTNFEVRLKEADVLVDIQRLDVVECLLGEGLFGLVEVEPGEVVGAHFEGVGDGEAVVDGHKLPGGLAGEGIFNGLHEDVACVTVEVQETHVEHSDLVNFVGGEQIG